MCKQSNKLGYLNIDVHKEKWVFRAIFRVQSAMRPALVRLNPTLYLVKFQVVDSLFFMALCSVARPHLLSPIARKFRKEIEHLKR